MVFNTIFNKYIYNQDNTNFKEEQQWNSLR